jgi:transcriptional regulator with XRE-family HTH domain
MVDRIQLILKVQNMTASRFADEIGVQRSSISHILSGRNMPSLDLITKILKRFPEIDSEWLLNGKGTMMKNQPDLFNVVDNQTEMPLFALENNVKKEDEVLPEETLISEKQIVIDKIPLPEAPETSIKVSESAPQAEKGKEIELNPIKELAMQDQKGIEKIVIFYTNKTFREYFPE